MYFLVYISWYTLYMNFFQVYILIEIAELQIFMADCRWQTVFFCAYLLLPGMHRSSCSALLSALHIIRLFKFLSNQWLGICLSLFCATITKYHRLDNLQWKEILLANGSGSWEVRDWGTSIWQGPSCYVQPLAKGQSEGQRESKMLNLSFIKSPGLK